MGLFGRKRSNAQADIQKEEYPMELCAPAGGELIAMEHIADPVFAEGIVGFCCGIQPENGKITSPVDGEITTLADTLHAISIKAADAEILIHLGIDTVSMNGRGFRGKTKVGRHVKKGDLLVTMNIDEIVAAGHLTTVIMAVTNSDDFSSVRMVKEGRVSQGDVVMRIEKETHS